MAMLALVLSTCAFMPARAQQAYANPVYSMYNAVSVEKETVKGCKPSKQSGTSDLVIFDDGSWAMTGVIAASGTWAQVGNTVYLSENVASQLLQTVSMHLTSACVKPTQVLEPTVIVKSMKLVLSPHGTGKFTMKMKGYTSDNQKFTYGLSLKGIVQQP